ncbi:MAG: hypothetical protein P8O23_05480 [Opitutales bacterium]|nr:hypothetical protein [Opitutales bacterium]
MILFFVYFFYWDTQHNIEGLWIYCGWMTLLFWQIFSGKINLTKESIEMKKRIEILEEVLMGIVPEQSYEAEKKKSKLKGGLEKRVEELELKTS